MFRPFLTLVFLTISLLAVGNNINYSSLIRLIYEEIVSTIKKGNKCKFFNNLYQTAWKTKGLITSKNGNYP